MSEQVQAEGKASEVTIVSLPEMIMVGFPVNVSFKEGVFSNIGLTKQRFMDNKAAIKHAVDPDTYWAPWYNCEVMFTYFYCLEVSELADIPEGMMGFTIPAASYATVRYEGPLPWSQPDPYGLLAEYRRDKGIESYENGMVLEKYRFDNDCAPNEYTAIEVFGPVKAEA
ncbi:GyrI-like domain-containing protein [Paenibacillus sp. MBLB4367]|uniref:GyrI-like domain-containing protein n=1 Tax=Paenibacillus sp. MBLB4367 TaxID=3384767 RepID=UPI003907FFCA